MTEQEIEIGLIAKQTGEQPPLTAISTSKISAVQALSLNHSGQLIGSDQENRIALPKALATLPEE